MAVKDRGAQQLFIPDALGGGNCIWTPGIFFSPSPKQLVLRISRRVSQSVNPFPLVCAWRVDCVCKSRLYLTRGPESSTLLLGFEE